MKSILITVALLLACASNVNRALAQMPAPPPAPEAQMRSAAELDQMLGPIALYPDPLLGQILPAATLPEQIVMADRYVEGGGDPNLIDQQPWDPSVQGLARYPAVLKWLDDNLAWTTAVGQAFQYQQQDVMDSIQRLRAQAQALGNLQNTPQENIVVEDGNIEILPANPAEIYVPVYQPDLVFYQQCYGTPFVTFGLGFSIGAWLNRDFDWHSHRLIVWGHDQPRPADWWTRRPAERTRVEVAHANVWRPPNQRSTGGRDLDRGWGTPAPRSTVTVIGSKTEPAQPRATPPPPAVHHPEPIVVQHASEASHPYLLMGR